MWSQTGFMIVIDNVLSTKKNGEGNFNLIPEDIFKALIFWGFEATDFSCSTPPTLIN
jgi:hypothetical protein